MEQQPVYAFGLLFDLLFDPVEVTLDISAKLFDILFDFFLEPVEVTLDLSAKLFDIIFGGCIAHKSAKPQHTGNNER